MVAAGMSGAGFRVGVGMLANQQRIQLSDDRYLGAGSGSSGKPSFDPGNGQSLFVLYTKFGELLCNYLRRTDLGESRLRVGQDILGDADDLSGFLVDCGAGQFFQSISA